MKKYRRVAIFLDYENLHSALKKRSSTHEHRYGFSAKIDFSTFLDEVQARFGPVHHRDFVVVANFTHYDQQKGGLNQFAELVHVDSFDARAVRQDEQPSAGKKYVVQNFADMRLAFEVGKHAIGRPAELYLLVTGDKAFAAVGHALLERGIDVVFILPDPDQAGYILLEQFKYLDFDDLHPSRPAEDSHVEAEDSPLLKPAPDVADLLAKTVSRLRRSLSTAIPTHLIAALIGPSVAGQVIQRAHSQGRIDLWTDPNGVECLSLRDERVYGKVVPQSIRKEIAERAWLLYHVAVIAESGKIDRSRAAWWRAIREESGYTVREAKQTIDDLLKAGILRIDHLDQTYMTMKNVLAFLQA